VDKNKLLRIGKCDQDHDNLVPSRSMMNYNMRRPWCSSKQNRWQAGQCQWHEAQMAPDTQFSHTWSCRISFFFVCVELAFRYFKKGPVIRSTWCYSSSRLLYIENNGTRCLFCEDLYCYCLSVNTCVPQVHSTSARKEMYKAWCMSWWCTHATRAL